MLLMNWLHAFWMTFVSRNQNRTPTGATGHHHHIKVVPLFHFLLSGLVLVVHTSE